MLVCVLALVIVADALPPVENQAGLRSFRNALNQQGFQTILQSIEDRLRNLDQVYMRYTKPDASVDQLKIKLDMIDSKLSRLESVIGSHMDKVTEAIDSKSFKDDMAKDQMSRKMDSLYDRLSNKINYFEEKVDMDILKLQSKIETGTSKLDRMEHSISVRHSDIETEVTDGIVLMEEIKTGISTLDGKMSNVTRSAEESAAVAGLLADIKDRAEHADKSRDDSLAKEINDHGNKMTNMYNDMWAKADSIEKAVKRSNSTLSELKNTLYNITQVQNANKGNQNDDNLEYHLDSLASMLQRRFLEMGRKFDSNFKSIILAQNLFLESCHRIQMDETQLENKIGLVLEKLLDSFTNRSAQTLKEMQSIEALIKEHDGNVFRSFNQNTNTVLKLSEKTTEDRKRIEKILSTVKQEIGNALNEMHEAQNGREDSAEYFNSIAKMLEKFQQQIADLGSIFQENIEINHKHFIDELKNHVKRFEETTSKEEVAIIGSMIKNIFYNLNSIEMKLNKSYLDYYFNRIRDSHRFSPKVTSQHVDMNNIFKTNDTKYVKNKISPDIFLEIFPEEKNSDLDRFNYTLVKETNSDMKNIDNTTQNIQVTDNISTTELNLKTEITEETETKFNVTEEVDDTENDDDYYVDDVQ